MTVSEYSHIKQQIMLFVSTRDKKNQSLGELKEHFRERINSPRRCEQIKTIGQLLHVLEVRDILSENNVYALKDIAQRINCDQEFINRINEFERSYIPTANDHYYSLANTQSLQSQSPKEQFKTYSSSNPYSNLSDRKVQRIYETIAEQIGTYWRDLARSLKVRECEIDNIDKSSNSLQSKAEKMLAIYKEKADTQKWVLDLCVSLEKARRKDLAKSVNDILVMNI